MQKKIIDINCDVGEGIGNEALLFPFISSCNIACGGHAGDAHSMRAVVQLAKKNKLKIGAHPSYPDKLNFGRVHMQMSKTKFRESIQEQLAALDAILLQEEVAMHHIKAHGALYNDLAGDPRLASEFLKNIAPYKPQCYLYVPYGSAIATEAARYGYNFLYEAFGDRAYTNSYSLAPRKLAGAVLEDPDTVLRQLLFMIREQKVRTLNGSDIPIEAHTFCIHGDTPSALQILMYLAGELPKYGIYLKE
jgi:UPF0271 protein